MEHEAAEEEEEGGDVLKKKKKNRLLSKTILESSHCNKAELTGDSNWCPKTTFH